MLLVSIELFPSDAVPFHDFGKLFLLSASENAPFGFVLCTACNALLSKSRFQRYARFKSSFAPGGERNKVDNITFLSAARKGSGFVTFVKSNAKALLTA